MVKNDSLRIIKCKLNVSKFIYVSVSFYPHSCTLTTTSRFENKCYTYIPEASFVIANTCSSYRNVTRLLQI